MSDIINYKYYRISFWQPFPARITPLVPWSSAPKWTQRKAAGDRVKIVKKRGQRRCIGRTRDWEWDSSRRGWNRNQAYH